MKLQGTTSLALALGLVTLGLAGCSSSGGQGGSLAITSCSLGCTSSGASGQVSCGITDVAVNQEIRIAFSSPVDITTVNNATFQVTELATGQTPPGGFTIDPNNSRILIYRPQLTFDSSGNPIFGLTAGQTYTVRIPGTNLDTGPFIQNTGGQANETRLQCTLVASLGVVDPNPGAPTVVTTVDVVTAYDAMGDPLTIAEDVTAQGAIDVFRDSEIKLKFNDVMNPGTLVNPVTGQSTTVTVRVDPDGNTADPSDQLDITGDFTLSIDPSALTTTVTFVPDAGYPSAGGDTMNPRKIVVALPNTITDLGGNPILNAGQVIFVPEAVTFPVQELSELFDNNFLEDARHSGSPWGLLGGLGTGPGGGSGRHGDLFVPTGATVTLRTDTEDFTTPQLQDPTIFNPSLLIEPTVFGTPDPVIGGVFEFATLQIEPGGTLRFVGPNAPRLFVRGETLVQGIIDVGGGSAISHTDTSLTGGVGGTAGPGGGIGGDGGMLPDGAGFPMGVPNPTAGPSDVLDPATYSLVNGQPGAGIPFPDTLDPSPTFVAGGLGGLAWPQPLPPMFPAAMFHFADTPTDLAGMQFDALTLCRNRVPGGTGGGGGHSLTGEAGRSFPLPSGINPATPAPNTPGGDSAELAIDDTVKSLDPEQGLLRGGPGGGGGGAHLQDSQVNGFAFVDCTMLASGDPGPLQITLLSQHSSAGGGGGGGGIQVQSGRRTVLDGVIDASGGTGGGLSGAGRAQGGGGGAGGGVLLQAPAIQIQAVPGRIDVSGGNGGFGPSGSNGGDGSPGFIRLETFPPLLDPATEAAKTNPTGTGIVLGLGAEISDVITVDNWVANPTGPATFSGAQSCWLQPDGNFFVLDFQPDGAELGWDMRLRLTIAATPQSYRGPNDLIGGTLEDTFTNLFGVAPVVVRFQGARTLGPIDDPCNVPLAGVESSIFPGSISGWVPHPNDLNAFFGSDPTRRPNMIRYIVLWDASSPLLSNIVGVEDLRIRVQPD